MSDQSSIVWFRNDLRTTDNVALAAAIASAPSVIPVFILDDRIIQGTSISVNRLQFLIESLADLRASLRAKEGDLVVRHGDPQAELAKLARTHGATSIHATTDYTPFARHRDEQLAQALSREGVQLIFHPGRFAIDQFDALTTGTGQPYKVFTPFYKRWLTVPRRPLADTPKQLMLPKGIDTGAIPALDELTHSRPSPDVIHGGETQARQRLHAWLEQGIAQYHNTHNDLGADATSRLSADLHFGTLSVREIEELLAPGEGPTAFRRQLAWRDFYQYVLCHFPNNRQFEFQERYRNLAWDHNEDHLEAWKAGMTGYPIVDAAMRQLLAEGWMHNRGRLIVGSFLTKDLGLDWRLGERHFMQHLVDGDTANNNGNWQWIASVGVDPAPLFRRLYNPTSQQKTYDPTGAYVRRYVPELAHVPDQYLAEPHKMPLEAQKQAGCIIDKDYPAPIVDHTIARKAALKRYRSAQ